MRKRRVNNGRVNKINRGKKEKHDARIAYNLLHEIMEIMCDMEVNNAGNKTN